MAFVGFSDADDNLPTVASPPPPTSSSAVAITDSQNLFEFGRTHRVPAKVLQALASALEVEDEDALTMDFALVPEEDLTVIISTARRRPRSRFSCAATWPLSPAGAKK